MDPVSWTLQVLGALEHPRGYSLADLRRRSPLTRSVVLECAGHRRNEFRLTTDGLQWGTGAVSEGRWMGVSLADLLTEVAPTGGACEVVFEGADRGHHHTSAAEVPFARSIPLERAFAGDGFSRAR